MFKTKQPHLLKDQALAHIPVKYPQVHESRQDDCVLLSYTLPVNTICLRVVAFFSSKLLTASSEKLELDARGTYIWDAINGNRSVAQLNANFAEKFDVTLAEAEASVAAFLQKLGQRRLITRR